VQGVCANATGMLFLLSINHPPCLLRLQVLQRGRIGPEWRRLEDETSALMFAAMNGHRDCVQLLLSHGADVDACVQESSLSVCGWTALHFAADRHKVNTATLLLHHGASWKDPPQPPTSSSSSAPIMGCPDIVLAVERCRECTQRVVVLCSSIADIAVAPQAASLLG
jgi:hypothetical protein